MSKSSVVTITLDHPALAAETTDAGRREVLTALIENRALDLFDEGVAILDYAVRASGDVLPLRAAGLA